MSHRSNNRERRDDGASLPAAASDNDDEIMLRMQQPAPEDRVFSSGSSEDDDDEGVNVVHNDNDDDDDDSYSDPLLVDPSGAIPATTETCRKVSFSVSEEEQEKVDERYPPNKSSALGWTKQGQATSSSSLTALLRRWLGFYVRFLQASPAHQDRLLKALQYTSWMAAFALMAVHPKNRRHQNGDNQNNTATTTSSRSTTTTTRAAAAAMILQKLSNDISFARYATRLLEFPTALQAVWTGCWTLQPSSASASSLSRRLYRQLGRLLSWSMAVYYPAEHAAYFLWMLPAALQTPDTSRRAAQLSAWSCRCWFVYLVADLVQSIVVQRNELPTLDNNDDDQQQQQQQQRSKSLKLQSLRNALFLLPCIHWSLPNWDTKPWLPNSVVNGLMWMEAMVCLYQTGLALPAPAEPTTQSTQNDDGNDDDPSDEKKKDK